MFCDRDNYYKGYSEGLEKGLLKDTNNFCSNVLNFLIATGTISAAIFAFLTWQDNKYISRLDKVIDAYYESFVPSIAADSISMEMYNTHILIKNVDVNNVSKNKDFQDYFAGKNIDLNELKKQRYEFYKEEIIEKIKNINPESYRLISSLEKIKPFITEKLKEDVEDFIASIKEVEFYLHEMKLSIKSNNLNDSDREKLIEPLHYKINEQKECFIELIDKIRNDLNI